MGDIWNLLIVRPFAWLLLSMYKIVGNYGVAIILFAIVAKVVLLYFSMRGKKATMQQQRLVPKQKELEARYKNDKVKYQEELQKLYQREGVSLMGGCLWMMLPIPVLIALYGVVREPLKNLMMLSSDQIKIVADYFGANIADQLGLAQLVHINFAEISALLPDAKGLIDINFNFLGLNLAEIPTLSRPGVLWFIPAVSGLTSYLSVFLSQKFSSAPPAQGSMKTMLLMSPVMSVWFGFILPSAMGIYWITNNILSVVQEYFLSNYFKKVFAEEDARKEALEKRRREAEEALKEENRLRRLQEGEVNKNTSKKKIYRVNKTPGKKTASPNGNTEDDNNEKEL